MMQHQWDLMRAEQFHKAYMQIAQTIASLSYCEKRKVGAVVVFGKNIMGYGFNGTVTGTPNICEDDFGADTCVSDVHAEMNAVLKAGHGCKGASMYITVYPCLKCTKLMAQAGIKKVYYLEDHKVDGRVELYGMEAFKMEL